METRKLIILNKIDQLEQVQIFLDQCGSDWELETGLVFKLNLVLEEYISNLVFYGYPDGADHEISLEISKEKGKLSMIVSDDGKAFNILETPENETIDIPIEDREIGGLGIHFIKTLMDQLEYSSDGNVNKLVMVKDL